MFNATEAPTPEPVVPASAFASEVEADVAVALTAAEFPFTLPLGVAVVVIFPIVRANEPAKPTDAAAPLFALDEMSVDVVSAVSAMPCALAPPAMSEAVVTLASVIATPAPTAALPPVALPSAIDAARADSDEKIVSAPVLTIAPPAATSARLETFASVTATAAATLTGPPDVVALGVAAVPEPVPSFAPAAVSAKPRWSPTWPVTSLEPPEGEPAADAVAVDDVFDGPVALSVVAAPALIERLSVAREVWSANVSANEAPTAAVPACVSPAAVVVAVASVLDVKEAAPATSWIGPGFTSTDVATLLIAIATAGAIAALGDDAPVFALVVIVLLPLAARVRALTFVKDAGVRDAGVPICARVVSSRLFSATDAPMPTDVPVISPGCALAFSVAIDAAVSVRLPPPALAEPLSAAVVSIFPKTSASDPATLTDPAAPLFAVAARLWLEAMSAVTSMPTPVALPSIAARFVTPARVRATAAPTAALPPVALPSAFALAFAASLA
jgi:hypothetical protein